MIDINWPRKSKMAKMLSFLKANIFSVHFLFICADRIKIYEVNPMGDDAFLFL